MDYSAIEAQIKAHALDDTSKECCGLVVRDLLGNLQIVKTPNIHDQPENYFQIPASTFLEYQKMGVLVAYYHSHPRNAAVFSEGDKVVSEELGVPMYLYSVPANAFAAYVPCGYRAPLEGREYVPLIHDCVRLVMDYYREKLNIVLPELELTTAERIRGCKAIRPWINASGCYSVQTPQVNDIVLIQICSAFPNHVAVLTEGNRLFHQLDGHRAKYDLYSGYWLAHTFRVLRHPKL